MYNIVNNVPYKNDIIYKYQFLFRKIHSTQHAIITLVYSGDLVISVFLYLEKSFNTVIHLNQILINKLFSYGFCGNKVIWFQSNLTEC